MLRKKKKEEKEFKADLVLLPDRHQFIDIPRLGLDELSFRWVVVLNDRDGVSDDRDNRVTVRHETDGWNMMMGLISRGGSEIMKDGRGGGRSELRGIERTVVEQASAMEHRQREAEDGLEALLDLVDRRPPLVRPDR
jgi:hypothetical protein